MYRKTIHSGHPFIVIFSLFALALPMHARADRAENEQSVNRAFLRMAGNEHQRVLAAQKQVSQARRGLTQAKTYDQISKGRKDLKSAQKELSNAKKAEQQANGNAQDSQKYADQMKEKDQTDPRLVALGATLGVGAAAGIAGAAIAIAAQNPKGSSPVVSTPVRSTKWLRVG